MYKILQNLFFLLFAFIFLHSYAASRNSSVYLDSPFPFVRGALERKVKGKENVFFSCFKKNFAGFYREYLERWWIDSFYFPCLRCSPSNSLEKHNIDYETFETLACKIKSLRNIQENDIPHYLKALYEDKRYAPFWKCNPLYFPEVVEVLKLEQCLFNIFLKIENYFKLGKFTLEGFEEDILSDIEEFVLQEISKTRWFLELKRTFNETLKLKEMDSEEREKMKEDSEFTSKGTMDMETKYE